MKKSKPIVVSFMNEKGGAGKSTNAINFARGVNLRDYRVLIVDSDPNGSSRSWHEAGKGEILPVVGLEKESIASAIRDIGDSFDFIIIDGSPGLNKVTGASIAASDVVIIPVQPTPHDIRRTGNILELIEMRQEINPELKAIFLISRAVKNTILGQKSLEAIQKAGLPVFKTHNTQTVAYPMADEYGKTVYETGAKPAIEQTDAIIDEFFERFINVRD